MSKYLDQAAIENALTWLNDQWDDNIPLRKADEWRDVLGQLKVHELRPAIVMLPADKRPEPEELLIQVKELREIFRADPAPIEEPTVSRPALPRELAKPDVVNPIIEKARQAITGRTHDQEAG